jgi:hypothetical protein
VLDRLRVEVGRQPPRGQAAGAGFEDQGERECIRGGGARAGHLGEELNGGAGRGGGR